MMMHRCLRSSLSHFSKTSGGNALGCARRSVSSAVAPSPKKAGPSKHASKTRTRPERPRAPVVEKKNESTDQYAARKALDPALEESGELAQQIAADEDEDAMQMAFLPGTFVEIRKCVTIQ